MKSRRTVLVGAATILAIPSAALAIHMVWLDVNRDGLDDAVRWSERGGAQLHLNLGDGSFEPSGSRFGLTAGLIRTATVLDSDRVVLVTREATQIWDLSRLEPVRIDGLPGAGRAESRDFDRDGRIDLILDGALWRQHENGRFASVEFDDSIPAGEPAATSLSVSSLAGGGDENVSVSGNVGINRGSPRTELDIGRNPDGDALSRLWIANDWPVDESAPSEVVLDRREVANSQIAAVGIDHTDRDFYVWVNGEDRLNITATGRVGVGTATPRAKLDVSGAIAVRGAAVIDAGGEWVGSPTGLQGPTGPSGPVGPSGPTGPAGSGDFTPKEADILKDLAHVLSMEMVSDGQGGRIPTLRFSGVNLQVVNGLGATNGYPDDPSSVKRSEVRTNGSGNLILGYNEFRSGALPNNRKGSHNLIAGVYQNHSSLAFGGVIAGRKNTVAAPYSSVTGGYGNTVTGEYSSVSAGVSNAAGGIYTYVSGGRFNETRGAGSSVSGGQYNDAFGDWSSVSGGVYNESSGFTASVSGGYSNTASGDESSVSGGLENVASGEKSSVSGGHWNVASGTYSSVSGGAVNEASAFYSSVSGGYSSEASGSWSSVSGGTSNEASSSWSSVSGGSENEASGESSSVTGGIHNVALMGGGECERGILQLC